jgi:23S rRNA pseudouridine955/2504/2580 synthase
LLAAKTIDQLENKFQVQHVTVGEGGEGQRLDNWLIKVLKGVPKSHVHRIIRAGEVRVNGKRAAADTRLSAQCVVRIPPVRLAQRPAPSVLAAEFPILFEDEHLLVIEKPAGVAVHGGSGVSSGVIEQLRCSRNPKFLELAHRLDRETSGILLLAKKRSALTAVQQSLREGSWKKEYLLGVFGDAPFENREVRLALTKNISEEGTRKVFVDEVGGQFALTRFTVKQRLKIATLMTARIVTGRTHQIRVHAAALELPLVGDERYGNFSRNKALRIKRMLLHAHFLSFPHPATGIILSVHSPMPADFSRELERLRRLALIDNLG